MKQFIKSLVALLAIAGLSFSAGCSGVVVSPTSPSATSVTPVPAGPVTILTQTIRLQPLLNEGSRSGFFVPATVPSGPMVIQMQSDNGGDVVFSLTKKVDGVTYIIPGTEQRLSLPALAPAPTLRVDFHNDPTAQYGIIVANQSTSAQVVEVQLLR